MKKTIEWNNLTFVIEDDSITVFDHNKRKTPAPEDTYKVSPHRQRELLKMVFDTFIKKGVRNDEVFWVLTRIVENPHLILFPPARDQTIEGERKQKQGR